jgi:ribonuclease HI
MSAQVGAADLAEFRARLAELRAGLGAPTAAGTFQVDTDGSAFGNPGPGGWAAIMSGPDVVWELWGHLSHTTNNRAEVLGVLAALEWAPAESELRVRSDSQLTLNQLTGLWKVKQNAELWAEIRRLLATKRLRVDTAWVRGHAGDPGNERANTLAQLGAANGDPDRAARPTRLPRELDGLQPQPGWETSFVSSVASQLRRGRPLSDKQQAVIDRIRARTRHQ